MSSIYKFFIILSCLFLSWQVQATADEGQNQLLDTAKMWLELSHAAPQANPNGQQREQIAQLLTATQDHVNQEVAKEAAKAGMCPETYLETEGSLNHFLASLKSTPTDKMTMPELLLFVIEGGERLQLQTAVRFPPRNYFDAIKEARNFFSALNKKLGITL